jgi:Metallo-beta-lactamase superfamily
MEKHKVGTDVTVLSDYAEVPGIGCLAVNTFVLHAEQPLVIDTGLSNADKDFVGELSEVIDPQDVRWIWITHPDRDHTGGLWKLLEAAPNARLVTTFIGVGIMSTEWTVPMDRVYLLNPGQQLDLGDRTVTGYRPPLFDNPATVGLLDDKTGTLFASDCFGGPMTSPELACGPDVRDVPGDELRAAQLLWASIDSPWVLNVDADKFAASVNAFRGLDPSAILSTHLPPAVGMNDTMFAALDEAPSAPEFVGPDQQALEALLATFEPEPVPEPV